jgi:hypothetical protein
MFYVFMLVIVSVGLGYVAVRRRRKGAAKTA